MEALPYPCHVIPVRSDDLLDIDVQLDAQERLEGEAYWCISGVDFNILCFKLLIRQCYMILVHSNVSIKSAQLRYVGVFMPQYCTDNRC